MLQPLLELRWAEGPVDFWGRSKDSAEKTPIGETKTKAAKKRPQFSLLPTINVKTRGKTSFLSCIIDDFVMMVGPLDGELEVEKWFTDRQPADETNQLPVGGIVRQTDLYFLLPDRKKNTFK